MHVTTWWIHKHERQFDLITQCARRAQVTKMANGYHAHRYLQHTLDHTRTVCNLATWQCTIRGNLDNTLSWALLWSPTLDPGGKGAGGGGTMTN
jgi:hypothetical protein